MSLPLAMSAEAGPLFLRRVIATCDASEPVHELFDLLKALPEEVRIEINFEEDTLPAKMTPTQRMSWLERFLSDQHDLLTAIH